MYTYIFIYIYMCVCVCIHLYILYCVEAKFPSVFFSQVPRTTTSPTASQS